MTSDTPSPAPVDPNATTDEVSPPSPEPEFQHWGTGLDETDEIILAAQPEPDKGIRVV